MKLGALKNSQKDVCPHQKKGPVNKEVQGHSLTEKKKEEKESPGQRRDLGRGNEKVTNLSPRKRLWSAREGAGTRKTPNRKGVLDLVRDQENDFGGGERGASSLCFFGGRQEKSRGVR